MSPERRTTRIASGTEFKARKDAYELRMAAEKARHDSRIRERNAQEAATRADHLANHQLVTPDVVEVTLPKPTAAIRYEAETQPPVDVPPQVG